MRDPLFQFHSSYLVTSLRLSLLKLEHLEEISGEDSLELPFERAVLEAIAAAVVLLVVLVDLLVFCLKKFTSVAVTTLVDGTTNITVRHYMSKHRELPTGAEELCQYTSVLKKIPDRSAPKLAGNASISPL